MRRLLVALVVCLAAGGCVRPASTELSQAREPACRYQGRQGTALVILMAQAVPTASQLPCVDLLPAGWSVSDIFVRNGRVRFSLDSDRVGTHAVRVVLERFCTDFNYEPMAFDAVDSAGVPVYHTNVVACIGTDVAMIALGMIPDEERREQVRERLSANGRTVVELTEEQIQQVMAQGAHDSH